MKVYIDGERPETLFCRRCLVTLIVAGSGSYPEKVEQTKHLHERQNPGRHGADR